MREETAGNRPAPNRTVVANWEERKFACSRACGYCDWRRSPELPRGAFPDDAVEAFAAGSTKGQVTISGGGDPLYRPDRHLPKLLAAAAAVRRAGKLVRVITRETEHVALLRGHADRVSVSLDQASYAGALRRRGEWGGLDVEYSAVLPPVPAAAVDARAGYYRELRRRLGARLVLRENLYSPHPLRPGELGLLSPAVVLVGRGTCLGAEYLAGSGRILGGRELTVDALELLGALARAEGAVVYGGLARNLAAPASNREFGDVDVAAGGPAARLALGGLGYELARRGPPPGALSPVYWEGRPRRMGLPVHLAEFGTRDEALAFVGSGQYDVSRVAWEGGRVVSPAAYTEAALARKATRLPDPPGAPARDPRAAAAHARKLAARGYALAGG